MAACDLKIELSDPGKVYVDGEKIRGEVIVRVDKACNCKALELTSGWATHGRGNVDLGNADSQVVFSGSWQPGTYRYPFELDTATWPPTYYGKLLNVSHQVTAQAKLAWAFDPKATVEFPVWATTAPEDVKPIKKQSGMGVIGWGIVGVLLLMLSFMFLFLLPILLVVGGSVWFFKSYLPKSRTGPVTCKVRPLRARAGQAIAGSIEFTPKRKTAINEIRAKIVCEEVCVSGSGSNRSTHREELTNRVERLLAGGELVPGQPQSLQFTYNLPADAPPSMDLSDNDLNWYVEFRIDIPRWPDFVEKIPLIVVPAEEIGQGVAANSSSTGREPTWFEQVIEQLQESAAEPERLELVLSAIAGHEFDVTLEIEEPASRPSQVAGIWGGTWRLAYDETHDSDFVLHVPDGMAAPELCTTWRGRIHIVGYNSEEEQVVVTAIPDADAK